MMLNMDCITHNLKTRLSCNTYHLFISLYKPGVALVILPLFHSLVLFQFLILNSSTEFIIQQILVLSLFQTHKLCDGVNPCHAPDVLFLSHAQIFMMKEVVRFHKPRQFNRSSVKSRRRLRALKACRSGPISFFLAQIDLAWRTV